MPPGAMKFAVGGLLAIALSIWFSLPACKVVGEPHVGRAGSNLKSALFARDTTVTLDTPGYSSVLPSFFLDFSGFLLPADHPLKIQSLDLTQPIFPVFPLMETNWGSESFAHAVVIPAKYLGLTPMARSSGSTRVFSVGRRAYPPKVQTAMDQLIKMGLFTFFDAATNNLYGASPEKYDQIAVGRSTSVGFSLSFGADKVLRLGDDVKWGLHLVVGNPGLQIGKISGMNLADQIVGMKQLASKLIGRFGAETPRGEGEKFIAALSEVLPYLRYHLAQNAMQTQTLRMDLAHDARFKAIYNHDFRLDNHQKVRPHSDFLPYYSAEFQQSWRELNKPEVRLRELAWSQELAFPVATTMISQSLEGNKLLQEVCDQLSTTFHLDQTLWPRCRISATLVPSTWSYPSGDIFVAAGLVGVLEHIDSLVLILAHQIAHNIGRHVTLKMPSLFRDMQASNYVLSYIGAIWSQEGGALLPAVNWTKWLPESMTKEDVQVLGVSVMSMSVAASVIAHAHAAEAQASRFAVQGTILMGSEVPNIIADGEKLDTFLADNLGLRRLPEPLSQLLSQNPQNALGGGFSAFPALTPDLRQTIPPELHKRYSGLHRQFLGLTNRFGATMRAKLRHNPQNYHVKYLQESIMAPGGRCIFYALKGL